MNRNDYIDLILKKIKELSKTRRTAKVLEDFLCCSAITISNSIDKKNWNEREELYLKCINQYKRFERFKISSIFANLVCALDASATILEPSDILGKIFENLDMQDYSKAQILTPEHISDFMAKLIINGNNIKEHIVKNGFISLYEPCSGTGRMTLSFIKEFARLGYNYCKQLFIVAEDIDIICVYCTYIQLSLYGIPAIVYHKNSLSEETFSTWYTPVYFWDRWYNKKIFDNENSIKIPSEEQALLF